MLTNPFGDSSNGLGCCRKGVGFVVVWGGAVHLSGWGVEIGIALDAALRHGPTSVPVVVDLLAVTRPD
jgi:hypothetical protein